MSVNDYDEELYAAVEDLVAEGELEKDSSAFGIAQKAIHEGYERLSPKQRTLYDAMVVPALRRRGEALRALHVMNSAEP
jgi:hypothetical protein